MPLPPEWTAQIAANKFLRWVFPSDGQYFAVDHAGKRSMRAGAILKARGVEAGILDWYFEHQGRIAWLEQKVGDNRPDQNQKDRMQQHRANGVYSDWFVTLEQLEQHLRAAGFQLRGTVGDFPSLPIEERSPPKKKRAASRRRAERPTASALGKVRAMNSKGLFW